MNLHALIPSVVRNRWSAWSERFAAFSRRERVLLALAVLAAFVLVGDSLFLSAARQRAANQTARLAEHGTALGRLQEQIAQLQAQKLDPDAANREALAAGQSELAELQARLRDLDGSLVPPNRAAALLENLVRTQRGVTLVSLKTLVPTPLVERPAAKGGTDKPAPMADGVPGIYRHGLEIKIAGSYADLQGYLASLEAAPQKLLWGRLDLKVERYPRSIMTLTVYTLSLDPAWLAF